MKGFVSNMQSKVQVPTKTLAIALLQFPLLYVSGDQMKRADSWT